MPKISLPSTVRYHARILGDLLSQTRSFHLKFAQSDEQGILYAVEEVDVKLQFTMSPSPSFEVADDRKLLEMSCNTSPKDI
jgi:hypothetical protein